MKLFLLKSLNFKHCTIFIDYPLTFAQTLGVPQG